MPDRRYAVAVCIILAAVLATPAAADWMTKTVPAGSHPLAVAVNPVTNNAYVANYDGENVAVIDADREWETGVAAEVNLLHGHVVHEAQPVLTGKAVNRWAPGRTNMMGVLEHPGTGQEAWDWTAVVSGAGTDSIRWPWHWDSDELLWGENFLCLVPLEDMAGVTNSLGFGTPFAGNLLVYPVYRVQPPSGLSSPEPGLRSVRFSVSPNPATGGFATLRIQEIEESSGECAPVRRCWTVRACPLIGHWSFGPGHSAGHPQVVQRCVPGSFRGGQLLDHAEAGGAEIETWDTIPFPLVEMGHVLRNKAGAAQRRPCFSDSWSLLRLRAPG